MHIPSNGKQWWAIRSLNEWRPATKSRFKIMQLSRLSAVSILHKSAFHTARSLLQPGGYWPEKSVDSTLHMASIWHVSKQVSLERLRSLACVISWTLPMAQLYALPHHNITPTLLLWFFVKQQRRFHQEEDCGVWIKNEDRQLVQSLPCVLVSSLILMLWMVLNNNLSLSISQNSLLE